MADEGWDVPQDSLIVTPLAGLSQQRGRDRWLRYIEYREEGNPVAINASLPGRLRNTSLPKSRALWPLFEAVVNAIQAVDDAHTDMGSTRIEVRIVRDPQAPMPPGEDHQFAGLAEPICDFVVSDNGVGFHDENMESFE